MSWLSRTAKTLTVKALTTLMLAIALAFVLPLIVVTQSKQGLSFESYVQEVQKSPLSFEYWLLFAIILVILTSVVPLLLIMGASSAMHTRG